MESRSQGEVVDGQAVVAAVDPHVLGRIAKGDVLLLEELGIEGGGGSARAGGRPHTTGSAPAGARGTRRGEVAPKLGEARLGAKPRGLRLQQG